MYFNYKWWDLLIPVAIFAGAVIGIEHLVIFLVHHVHLTIG